MVAGRPADQLIVIVGPTASGKSDVAIKIAKEFDGEIISADSRTIYKNLDIGTAKPSITERQGVMHFGFDLIDPSQTFSAAQFQQLATGWIKDIRSRGKLPIMVGGTGLYVDSILFNYRFGLSADPKLREKLSSMSLQELWMYCKEHNIELPENYKNKRYVVRAIEQGGINVSRSKQLRANTIVVGLAPKPEELKLRLRQRAIDIFKNNVVQETMKVLKEYGPESPGLTGNVYPIIQKLIAHQILPEQAIEHSTQADWRLAKRQLTWFRRNPHIRWFADAGEAHDFITEYLSKIT